MDHPHIIRRGHKYLMVVVDHDSGRLVWAAAGHPASLHRARHGDERRGDETGEPPSPDSQATRDRTSAQAKRAL